MNDDEILHRFSEPPLPPAAVDLPRAIRAGRRRRRSRVAVALAATFGLLLGGGLTVPGWLGGGADGLQPAQVSPTPQLPGLPCVSPSSSSTPSSPQPGGVPEEFDVLRRWVTVGDLPGVTLAHSSTARYWQALSLEDLSRARAIEVIVFARGGQPVFSDPPGSAPRPIEPTAGIPADPVAGRTAFWLPGRQGMAQYDVARLGWQWADGAWAFVAVADLGQQGGPPDPETVARMRTAAQQVAGALQIADAGPVRLPFTVTVPQCAKVNGTFLLRSATATGPFVQAAISFGRWDNANPIAQRPDDGETRVTVDSTNNPDDKPGRELTTVDGHPALVNGGYLAMYDVAGFMLEVTAAGAGPEQVLAYARTVRVIPGAHADESLWTDRPIAGS